MYCFWQNTPTYQPIYGLNNIKYEINVYEK